MKLPEKYEKFIFFKEIFLFQINFLFPKVSYFFREASTRLLKNWFLLNKKSVQFFTFSTFWFKYLELF